MRSEMHNHSFYHNIQAGSDLWTTGLLYNQAHIKDLPQKRYYSELSSKIAALPWPWKHKAKIRKAMRGEHARYHIK